jgi:glycosyltransferase involved in cell wall biosynthesis
MTKSHNKAAPKALLVLGMHRSGTSAFTRIVNLLGAELSDKLLPPQDDNDQGFWEHKDVVALHDRVLDALHSAWDDPRSLPEGWWKEKAMLPFKKEIKALIARDFSKASFWAVKDPRISLMLPLWLEVLKEEGIEAHCVTVVRSAESTALSLHKRNGYSYTKSLLLWLRYNLSAEQGSRGVKRSFVQFDALLEDWNKELVRVVKETGLPLRLEDKKAAKEIATFIDPKHVHHAPKTLSDVPKQLAAWVKKAKGLLADAAKGKKNAGGFTKLSDAVQKEMAVQSELYGFWAEEALENRKFATELHVSHTEMADALKNLEGKKKDLAHNKKVVDEQRKSLDVAYQQVAKLDYRARTAEGYIENLHRSVVWKVLSPLMLVETLLRTVLNVEYHKRVFAILREQGIKGFVKRLKRFIRVRHMHKIDTANIEASQYEDWLDKYEKVGNKTLSAVKKMSSSLPNQPTFSIVMPTYNPAEKWLREAIDSVLAQTYPHWELCIADDASTEKHVKQVLEQYRKKDKRIKVAYRKKNGHISEASNTALESAEGEFVVLMDHDDVIPAYALSEVAAEINAHPSVDLLYSDEDKIDEEGKRYQPHFKSGWNPDLFYSQNMISHLGVYRRSIVEKIGGFRKGYEGAQDYDLALRFIAEIDEQDIRHIPRVLYHWRAIEGSTAKTHEEKDYAAAAARNALQDYFKQTHKGAKVVDANVPGYHRVKWPTPEKEPLVSLIIPTRNQVGLLRQCIESIVDKTTYKNYEILVVDNQSDEADTLEYFEVISRAKNIRVLPYDKPFNYSAINNFAVKEAKGDIIGLVNNDIEVIAPEWLSEMVSHTLRKDVGVVGAKLYYPDNSIQHAGVVLGIGATSEPVAGHMFLEYSRHDRGYFDRAVLTQNLAAVTAACFLVRKEVFEEVGGLNEKDLTVAFNDVDFCLKVLHAGYRNLWTPYAELYHHESASRGKEDTPEKQARFAKETRYMRETWKDIIDEDPYYNRNLDNDRADYKLSYPPRVRALGAMPALPKKSGKRKAA